MTPRSASDRPLQTAVVPVDDLAPGMVLGEDVTDPQGRLLLPSGTSLTERHLRAFQMWGVMGVKLRGVGEADQSEPVTPEQLSRAVEAIQPRFRHNDRDNPLMAEVFRLCAEREAQLLAAEARRDA